jgi:hypothetical protein
MSSITTSLARPLVKLFDLILAFRSVVDSSLILGGSEDLDVSLGVRTNEGSFFMLLLEEEEGEEEEGEKGGLVSCLGEERTNEGSFFMLLEEEEGEEEERGFVSCLGGERTNEGSFFMLDEGFAIVVDDVLESFCGLLLLLFSNIFPLLLNNDFICPCPCPCVCPCACACA